MPKNRFQRTPQQQQALKNRNYVRNDLTFLQIMALFTKKSCLRFTDEELMKCRKLAHTLRNAVDSGHISYKHHPNGIFTFYRRTEWEANAL